MNENENYKILKCCKVYTNGIYLGIADVKLPEGVFVDAPLTSEQIKQLHQIEEDFIRKLTQLSHRSDGIYGG